MYADVVMFECESWTFNRLVRNNENAVVTWSYRRVVITSRAAKRRNVDIFKEVNKDTYARAYKHTVFKKNTFEKYNHSKNEIKLY